MGLINPNENKPKNKLNKFLNSPLFLIQVSQLGAIASIIVLTTRGFNLFNTSNGKSFNLRLLLINVEIFHIATATGIIPTFLINGGRNEKTDLNKV
jgi:hypothetical protein